MKRCFAALALDVLDKTRFQSLPVIVCLALVVLLLLLPTGFEGNRVFTESDIQCAKVLDADNTTVFDTGLVRTGDQRCTVRVLRGRFKGCTAIARNTLTGSLEQDKIFKAGDKALVRINFAERDDKHSTDSENEYSENGNSNKGGKVKDKRSNGEILSISMIDHYRAPQEVGLAALFVVLLMIVAGMAGARAILSFALCVLAIWKVLIPLYLKGFDPILTGLAITFALTFFIIALVYGFDNRTLAAASGAFLGVISSCFLSIVFTRLLRIHGAVMPYSESLLYAGYSHLSLTRIFEAGIFIAASGAVTDLAVDITSASHEVIRVNPRIAFTEAAASGMRVGRAAMGTMTTTLLLAYSGSYAALLMVFMAQGTPIQNILNYKYIAAEMVHTVIGSLCLVLTAPFTALCAAALFTSRHNSNFTFNR